MRYLISSDAALQLPILPTAPVVKYLCLGEPSQQQPQLKDDRRQGVLESAPLCVSDHGVGRCVADTEVPVRLDQIAPLVLDETELALALAVLSAVLRYKLQSRHHDTDGVSPADGVVSILDDLVEGTVRAGLDCVHGQLVEDFDDLVDLRAFGIRGRFAPIRLDPQNLVFRPLTLRCVDIPDQAFVELRSIAKAGSPMAEIGRDNPSSLGVPQVMREKLAKGLFLLLVRVSDENGNYRRVLVAVIAKGLLQSFPQVRNVHLKRVLIHLAAFWHVRESAGVP